MKTDIHNKDFARRLTSKLRLKCTRKWLIWFLQCTLYVDWLSTDSRALASFIILSTDRQFFSKWGFNFHMSDRLLAYHGHTQGFDEK